MAKFKLKLLKCDILVKNGLSFLSDSNKSTNDMFMSFLKRIETKIE